MADRIGFAMVEPHYLTGIITAEFYDQYPADKEVLGDILENGRFVKAGIKTDSETGKSETVVTDGTNGFGEWYMIYNEEVHYDERETRHKDFAMNANDYYTGTAVPRCIKIPVGDRFTTNAIPAADAVNSVDKINALTNKSKVALASYTIGNLLTVGTNGYLTTGTMDDEIVFKVIPDFRGGMATTPDGEAAVKVIRIK